MVTEREKQQQAEEIAAGVMADSTLFGFRVPKEVLLGISPFLPKLVALASEHGAKFIEQHLGGLLQSLNVSQAQPIAKYTGLTFAYALPFANNITQLVKTGREHNENYTAFVASIAPVLEAHNRADGAGNSIIPNIFSRKPENAMIAYGTKILNDISIGRLKQNVIDSANAALQTVNTSVKNNLANLRNETISEWNPAEKREFGNMDNNKPKFSEFNVSQDIIEKEKKMTNTVSLLEDWGGAAVGMVTGFFGAGVKVKDPEKAIAASSLGSVSKIEAYMHTNGLSTLSRTAERSELLEVTNLVKETFERFQKEQNETAWSKAVLQKISTLVASELIEGDLAAQSLIYLIGDRKFHDLPEKYAQTRTMLAGEEEPEKELELWLKSRVQEIIQEETKIFSKDSRIDVTSFMENVSYAFDNIKEHAEAPDSFERDLTIALHPRSVLLAAGLSEEEISQSKNAVDKEVLIGVVQSVIEHIATMDPEALSDIGYDKKSIALIHKLAENPDEVAQLFESNRERTVGLVRNALFNESVGEWTHYINESRVKSVALMDKEQGEEDPKTHLDKVKRSKHNRETAHTPS